MELCKSGFIRIKSVVFELMYVIDRNKFVNKHILGVV